MLHINIVGVATCSQITPLADLSRVSLDFFSIHFIRLSHYTVPLLLRQHHKSQYKKQIKN